MFRKKSYSDLEVQEIMETLFQEKKKVKELQMKLGNCSPPPFNATPSSEELTTLKTEVKNLIVRLEKSKIAEQQSEQKRLQLEKEIEQHKYHSIELDLSKSQTTKLLSQIEESEVTISQLQHKLQNLSSEENNSDKQKEASLERVVQFMRSRLEEVQLENEQVLQKFAEIEASKIKLQEECLQAKNAEQKLVEAVQLEKQMKQDLIEEESALKAQLEQLRNALSCTSDGEKSHKDALLDAQREIELLKQMMMKSLHEAKEEKLAEDSSYQNQIASLTTELTSTREQLVNLNRALDDQTSLAEGRQKQLSALENNHHLTKETLDGQGRAYQELAQFVEEMKAKLVQSEEDKTALSESLIKKEELLHHLSAQVASSTRSLEKMEDATRQHTIEKQEHEADLRQAGAHLAKKMREVALLTEQMQELKIALVNLENELQDAKNSLMETKASLEAETIQKQSLQKQYHENLKAIELQSNKWEEKFFQIQEKWQETEARNRELKRIEERFGKLQNAFNHIGSIISPQASFEVPSAASFDIPPPAKTFTEMEMEPITAASQAPLFEGAAKGSRYKESLFG